MDLLDTLALWNRRYDRRSVVKSGSSRYTLGDLLEAFDRQAILELTPVTDGKPGPASRPDLVKKVKVSLLDQGVSAIHPGNEGWYEVYQTAPSGDISKVKVIAHSKDGRPAGEIRMIVGQRSLEYYFRDDPILQAIERGG